MHLEIFREVKELMLSSDFQIEQEKLVMCIYILRKRETEQESNHYEVVVGTFG